MPRNLFLGGWAGAIPRTKVLKVKCNKNLGE